MRLVGIFGLGCLRWLVSTIADDGCSRYEFSIMNDMPGERGENLVPARQACAASRSSSVSFAASYAANTPLFFFFAGSWLCRHTIRVRLRFNAVVLMSSRTSASTAASPPHLNLLGRESLDDASRNQYDGLRQGMATILAFDCAHFPEVHRRYSHTHSCEHHSNI
jgi:hypothetical protein